MFYMNVYKTTFHHYEARTSIYINENPSPKKKMLATLAVTIETNKLFLLPSSFMIDKSV